MKNEKEFFEVYPKLWIVIEWYSDNEKGKSIHEVHVFDTRQEAREFKKYRADEFLDSSFHEGNTGS